MQTVVSGPYVAGMLIYYQSYKSSIILTFTCLAQICRSLHLILRLVLDDSTCFLISLFHTVSGWKMRSRRGGLWLNELKVFTEYFFWQTIKVHCFTHGLIHSTRCLFHFLVLQDQILLELIHGTLLALNSTEFIIWLCFRNFKEDLEDLIVLVLHVHKAHLLSFVLPDKFLELVTSFNLVKTLDELICKSFDPINVLLLDTNKSFSNAGFPFCN